MADKRISQLVDRGTVANNDVVPIVVSGATTTNKATISSIQTFMQGNLDVGVTSVGITLGSTGTDVNVTGSPITSSGNITINFPTASATNRGLLSSANWSTFNSKVSSVGLSMPSAFSVANSPITGSGTIAITGAGTVSQYIRGDGSLADFPAAGGGGSSVSYYLNGSVSQGTIGGIAYQEMNKVPVLGAGTDFVAIADGYLASFITDAGDPALLNIPAGNWNFETYFSASSAGGTPTFYIELYKVDSGGTATLIASNSATPELIAFGTTTTPYFSALAVPSTVLTITDRLALRYFVSRSGRTITLHTENSHLCQIITTFTTGLTALNGLTAQVQNLATGTSGTDFGISSSVSTHTFNLPDASASARGVVTTGTQTIAGIKTFNSTIVANNDIQLAAAGTASTTFIKNISGSGLTSIGSNGFGFNNSDNIYFSGSNKGGGIIAFSNTGNQTYTLPDASGTIALTSNLSAYLPLAGGTLTGALNGTSATFSSSVTAASATFTQNTSSVIDILTLYNVSATSAGVRQRFQNGFGDLAAIRVSQRDNGALADDGQIEFQVASNSVLDTKLTILNTGAATFSSSVGVGAGMTIGTAGTNDIAWGTAGGIKLSRTNVGPEYALNQRWTGSLAFVDIASSSQWNGGVTILPNGGGNVGIGTTSPSSFVEMSKTSNSGSGGTFPRLTIKNTLATQGDGSATFNFADINISSGNEAVNMFITTTYASGTWSPAGIINVATNHDLQIKTNNTERMRITSGGNVGIGTASPTQGKLVVTGNTYSEGLYVATGQFSQGAGTTSTFYTFSNISDNRVFIITLRQSGGTSNNVVAMGFTFGGVLAAYNIAQDNTNAALFLTITSTGGLGLRLTTGSGYGTTTWDWTITQIK